MKYNPLVSVVVPIYKTEAYLSRCIESICSQTYKKLEILLVDDGSPDACPHICDNYALLDKRIKVIHKNNGGISSARNTGLNAMSGDYVTFIDSDDFLHKDCIRYLTYLALRKDAQVTACGLYKGSDSSFDNVSVKGRTRIYEKVEAFLSRKIKSGIVGKLFQSSLFDELRFPESDHFNYEDEALYYKLVDRCQNMAITEKPLYYYYQSPESTTRITNHHKTTDFIQVFEDRIHYFAGKEKELLELSWEYYALCLMFFYMNCKKDPLNTNDLEEIVTLYHKAFFKVIYNEITPFSYKVMFTVFYYIPKLSAQAVNRLKLR